MKPAKRCGFCRRVVWATRGVGQWHVLVPTVDYIGKVFCASPCWGKLQVVARATAGVL